MKMIDLTDGNGNKVFVNPLCVCYVASNYHGGSLICFGDEENFIKVKEGPPDVADRLSDGF